MSIYLTADQRRILENAVSSGMVASIDEFFDSAVKVLSSRVADFDLQKAKRAAETLREMRRGVKLHRGGTPFRDLAHIGHRY